MILSFVVVYIFFFFIWFFSETSKPLFSLFWERKKYFAVDQVSFNTRIQYLQNLNFLRWFAKLIWLHSFLQSPLNDPGSWGRILIWEMLNIPFILTFGMYGNKLSSITDVLFATDIELCGDNRVNKKKKEFANNWRGGTNYKICLVTK